MRIRISKRNDELIDKLKALYNFKFEGIVPRIAFAYSLQLEKRFDVDTAKLPPSDGRDFRDDKGLFGTFIGNRSNYVIFKSLLDQHYERELYEDEFSKLFRLHLDFGLERMNSELENKSFSEGYHINYLMKMVNDGISILYNKPKINIQSGDNIELKEHKKLIEINLGMDGDNNPIKIRLNDLNDFDSNHIAIAGMTGSGKTEMIKDILYQITKQTGDNLNFIFFDYKGEQKEKIEDFLNQTNAQFIDVLNDDYEFNPLSIISSEDKDKRDNQILTFADTLCGIAQLGPKQSLNLRKVIREYFEQNDKRPTVEDINEALQLFYEESKIKPDTLIDIFDKLSRGIFTDPSDNTEKIYNKNIYLNLPSSIPETVRQLTVFFTLKYLLSIFSNSTDTQPNEDRIKPLRYIVVIDEAHVYLKNKNARGALQEMLRVLRSKGVVVVMLSQGAEDYRQKDFDFSSQVKIPICLNVKNKDYKLIEPFVGTPSSKYKLEQAIENLDNGYGIINLKEPQKIEINQFWKTRENSK